MNVVLLVVDSLRACSLFRRHGWGPQTPFLSRLSAETMYFRRAYATECWTLPTHCSIFTGLLPSEHGAHFQTMGYHDPSPTIAEILSSAGFWTEVVTRNFVFDGTIPGVTRGFQRNTQLLSEVSRVNPFALFLALAKPRFRRHVRKTGFFHPFHRDNRRFLSTFARALMPADRQTLDYALESMVRHRSQGQPFFLFCNLYDVHAPYPPSPRSILRSFRSASGCIENLMFPSVMASLGAHRYLRPGFRLSERGRRMLLERYHRAIELMDAKLADFFAAARGERLLDDTLLILTSDHGEAFGDHGLYLHDASVYNTHLHVPLWIHHPDLPPAVIDDVVSTRDLFGVIRCTALGRPLGDTIQDPACRARRPIAVAEHFYYPHAAGADPRYRQNLAAAIGTEAKIILRGGRAERFDLGSDPDELDPRDGSLAEFARTCRQAGIGGAAVDDALDRLRSWQDTEGLRQPDAA
jgi:hypothetical protein